MSSIFSQGRTPSGLELLKWSSFRDGYFAWGDETTFFPVIVFHVGSDYNAVSRTQIWSSGATDSRVIVAAQLPTSSNP